jgi:Radical SAM superfamily
MKRFFNFTKVQPIPAGVYQKQGAPAGQPPYRIHLRLQPDGSGVMVVNAATVLHLNPTAAECAYHFVKGTEPGEAAREIAARYRVSRSTALSDFQDFADRVQTLVTTPDLDPVSYLDFERVAPHSTDLTAPLRLDCALTYRLPPGTQAAYAPTKRVDRELETAEWKMILEKAWEVGIPHVTFTGGEATLREDLVALIARAESIGQVCGLLTGGLKLADKSYLNDLLQAGLDHILMILQPARQESWAALRTILPEDIFVTVHLTIDPDRAQDAPTHLERLASMGVKSLSLSFTRPDIPSAGLVDRAAALGLAIKHDLPVPYSADNPVARETE